MADQAKTTGSKTPKANEPDENNLKMISALGYLGILFFVPMLMFPKSKFAMFHANQALLLLIAALIIQTVGWVIPVIGWFVVIPLGSIFLLVLFIMGVINAFGGKMQRLPVIGGYDIIKVQE